MFTIFSKETRKRVGGGRETAWRLHGDEYCICCGERGTSWKDENTGNAIWMDGPTLPETTSIGRPACGVPVVGKLVVRIMELEERYNQEYDRGRNHATTQGTRRKFDGFSGAVATALNQRKFFHFL